MDGGGARHAAITHSLPAVTRTLTSPAPTAADAGAACRHIAASASTDTHRGLVADSTHNVTCAASNVPVKVTTGSRAHAAMPVTVFTASTASGARARHLGAQTCADHRARRAGGRHPGSTQDTERSRSSSLLIASRSTSCLGPSLNRSSLHRSRG